MMYRARTKSLILRFASEKVRELSSNRNASDCHHDLVIELKLNLAPIGWFIMPANHIELVRC